jgi:hypothetical protein
MLSRFIDTFKKAVTVEMDAMRSRMGPFEIPLAQGKTLNTSADKDEWLYGFKVLQPNDKLVLGTECNLIAGSKEHLVTLTTIDKDQITLRTNRQLDPKADPLTLVIYPWFLYEKLQAALQDLIDSDRFHTDTALQLFGKGTPRDLPVSNHDRTAANADPPDTEFEPSEHLNPSQQQAVQLCKTRTPAFVWGPPGTGKTTTLVHIITALMQQGQRVLVTSTTNAAVDQALAKLAALGTARDTLEEGRIVRIGQTQAPTFGAGLHEVVEKLNTRIRTQLDRLGERHLKIQDQIAQSASLLTALEDTVPPNQMELFVQTAAPVLDTGALSDLFGARHAARIAASPTKDQQTRITRRQRRLEHCLELGHERIQALQNTLRQRQAGVVQKAQVVLATMSNVYISNLMQQQRFDAVIVEEASMAVLPTLFYCAALAAERVIMVGDPRQLPPIVQSTEPYVQRAMGRSIFEITVPEPHNSDLVVMLDTQYRMHPKIGDLVGDLFYQGRLHHSPITHQTVDTARSRPYANEPLVVVDTSGQTTCATPPGTYSRYNEKTAAACVALAAQAVADGIESVALITPYVEQSRRIRRLLLAARGLAEKVKCRTVHRFQGGERDMVIFDTVDAAPLPPGTLLASTRPNSSAPNLINVSISRARAKLVILADVAYFKQHEPNGVISEMLRQASASGLLVSLGAGD